MALYCTIVIALALFADFVLLPVTILKFEKGTDKAVQKKDLIEEPI